MPNITEYSAPAGNLRPSELPQESLAREGYMAGRLGNETASMIRQTGQDWDRALTQVGRGVGEVGKVVEQHQANQEITNGALGLAQTIDGLDQDYSKAASTPEAQSDPNFTRNWLKTVMDPHLQQFRQQFNTVEGQRWAAEHVATAATEFYRHVTAADMNRAADQATVALTQTTNTLGALAHRSPAMTDMALGMIPGTVDAIARNANLSPEAADKLRTTLQQTMQSEIASAGIRGAIENLGPEAGQQMLNSGKYNQFLTPAQVDALNTHVGTMTKIQAAEEKARKVTQQRAEDDQVKAAATNLQASTITSSGPQIPQDYWNNLKQIAELSGAGRQHDIISELGSYGQKLQNAEEKAQRTGQKDAALNTTDPGLMENAIGNVANGSMSSSQVLKQVGNGISARDAHWLSTQTSDDQKTDLASLQSVLSGAKTTILGGDPASWTARGMANYGRAQATAIQAFRTGRDAGIPANELLDPDNKSFILPHIEQYGSNTAALPPTLSVEAPHFLHPFHMPEIEAPSMRNEGGPVPFAAGGADSDEGRMLAGIRQRESSGDYTATNPHSTASGAYQILDSTWQEATHATGIGKQYARASDAPAEDQDANALWLLRNRGTGQWSASSRPSLATVFGSER